MIWIKVMFLYKKKVVCAYVLSEGQVTAIQPSWSGHIFLIWKGTCICTEAGGLGVDLVVFAGLSCYWIYASCSVKFWLQICLAWCCSSGSLWFFTDNWERYLITCNIPKTPEALFMNWLCASVPSRCSRVLGKLVCVREILNMDVGGGGGGAR